MAARDAPAQLDAVAPGFTSPDPLIAPWYHDGVLNLHMSLWWTLSMALAGAGRDDRSADADEIEALAAAVFDPSAELRRLPLRDQPLLERHPPWYREWLDHPTRDAFWESVAVDPSVDSIELPTLQLAGWSDIFSDRR